VVKLAFEEARAARPGKRALSAFGLDALDRGARLRQLGEAS
jgi:hypothetical protein